MSVAYEGPGVVGADGMDDDVEPGAEPGAPIAAAATTTVAQVQAQMQRMQMQQQQQQLQQQQYGHQQQHAASAFAAAAAAAPCAAAAAAAPLQHPHPHHPPSVYVRPAGWPEPTLYAFLLNTSLNRLLASFLVTRDLFSLQFLNRSCFTLLNSNAALLHAYYETVRLDSFIPFLVDDAFLAAFLTPTYLSLPDGATAVRNTYSMHIRHMRLAFCTRISDRAMQLVAQHIGQRLLSINIEGGGRSRVTEQGMQVLFANCNKLQSVNLNGCYQLNMVTTIGHLMQHCSASLTSLSLNGCAQLNESALSLLQNAKQMSSLSLNSVPLHDNSLTLLASAFKERLRTLHMGYCGAITDRGLAALVGYCRNLTDLNLYGCTGLSRHALSYLRLCPLLEVADISRIHSLDDGSIAEWVLPTSDLQAQQNMVQQLIQQSPSAGGGPPGGAGAAGAGRPAAASHPDLNAALPQIFAAQSQSSDVLGRSSAATRLRSVSLDSCARVSSLGLKVLLEQCPSLTFLNAFGVSNLSLLALQSLCRIAQARRSMLRQLQIGGGGGHALHARDVDALRKEFPQIAL